MVASAVSHFLSGLKFGDNGLRGQFAPVGCRILGVAHLRHTQEIEFLVAAVNEINKFGTCEPIVYQ